MRKIKVVGAVIFVLSLLLAFLSSSISTTHKTNTEVLNTLNEYKSFTQEISKSIFYIYKNKDASIEELDEKIRFFVENINTENALLHKVNSPEIQKQNKKILLLWNKFYLYVQNFRDNAKVQQTLYSGVLLEDIVKDVYNTNLELVVAFDALIGMYKEYFSQMQSNNRNIEYTLFLLLLVLLIYLFSQVKNVLSFIQKFVKTSKNIIKSSSIKELKHIDVVTDESELSQASQNFNYLVDKINNSIEFSAKSIQNSYTSLEVCEKNIEELMELISIMEDDIAVDKELAKKEDALILSLEELSISAKNLKNLKKDLQNLISLKEK